VSGLGWRVAPNPTRQPELPTLHESHKFKWWLSTIKGWAKGHKKMYSTSLLNQVYA
jgi:hypothetical protein